MVYLIAGCGPAGVAAAKAIRGCGAQGDIIMLNPEGGEPYSKIALPDYAAGLIDEDGVLMERGGFFSRVGARVVECGLAGLDAGAKTALLQNGEELRYDRLLLCTGAQPVLPPFARGQSGVFTLGSLREARKLREAARTAGSALVIGGGLSGMHAAQALRLAQKSVAVLEKLDAVMSRQLDEAAQRYIIEAAGRNGVRVVTGADVRLLRRDADGWLAETDKGDLRADIVIVAAGVRANTDYLAGQGLSGGALAVDEYMGTSLPGVYAAGDMATDRDRLSGESCERALWPCAVEQGRVAGVNMAGGALRYRGSVALNSLHLFDTPVISAGEIYGDELVLYRTRTAYAKLVMRGEALAGFVLAGSVGLAGGLYASLGRRLPAGLALRLRAGCV